jgi:replicative DNA helicase
MKRNEAKTYIQENATRLLEKDKSGRGYICPLCNSGSGRNGTGITTQDNIHYTCWACGEIQNADIIDIVGLEYGLTDYNEKLAKAGELLGITVENDPGAISSTGNQKQAEKTPKQENDFTAFFKTCSDNLEKTDYFKKRGLSLETVKRFNIGYCEAWKHPKAPTAPASPRLIIPTSPTSYLARDTRQELNESQQKYSKQKVGDIHIFNIEALEGEAPIFIVEGEIDALSIIEAGGEAIGLGSAGNVSKLLEILKTKKPKKAFIIALDNDDTGRKAQAKLIEGLEDLGLNYIEKDIAQGFKDSNEALIADVFDFAIRVNEAKEEAIQASLSDIEKLEKENAYNFLEAFNNDINQDRKGAFLPTGFPSLDTLLDGGIYSGLYIVGAVSSLGKTTFCLQIADNIAESGKDVLIFSLEMAKKELIAKSISRLTCKIDVKESNSTTRAKTTRGILLKGVYKYSQGENDLIAEAMGEYSKIAKHIYITEGVGNITVETIKRKVENFIRITGRKPLVIIDYLQIIAPSTDYGTDKQNTDKAITALKRLSRDNDLAILGISSLNRASYNQAVDMGSFKESGAIEYSSDVLIGLQYKGMEGISNSETSTAKTEALKIKVDNTLKAQNGDSQEIQVNILKNRNGTKGGTVLDFYPKFNYFKEQPNKNAGNYEGWKKIGG